MSVLVRLVVLLAIILALAGAAIAQETPRPGGELVSPSPFLNPQLDTVWLAE